jgi:tol-pal system protein YbgF
MKKLSLFLLVSAAFLAATSAFAEDDRPASATYNETRLTAQENALRELNGRVEQVEFSVRRLEQALQRLQTDTEARLAKIESAQTAAPSRPTPPPSSTPAAQPNAPQQTPAPTEPAGTLGALKMQGNKVTGGVNKPEAPPLPAVPSDYGLNPQEQYEKAFNYLRESDYADAEEAFKTFIEKNPKDKLIENAKYWYGETLYVRARYDEAAVAFADAYQQNPKGVKAPDALLKLGMSLAALNKTPDACVTLAELKSKYPNAAPAIKTRADDERAKLKCPAR